MGSMSLSHWLIVLAIVLLVFGAGKIPQLMGDMAKGIKTFKKGMQDDEEAPKTPDGTPAQPAAPKPIEHAVAKPAPSADGTKVG